MDAIKGFNGKYRFLSNFSGGGFVCQEVEFPQNEYFFQWMKTFNVLDKDWILSQPTPGLAKKAGSSEGLNGRKILLRGDWNEVRDDIMAAGLRLKFANPHLKELLLSTGDAYLEETNYWNDRYWGVCRGMGKNRLGFLLMQVREEFRLAVKRGENGGH